MPMDPPRNACLSHRPSIGVISLLQVTVIVKSNRIEIEEPKMAGPRRKSGTAAAPATPEAPAARRRSQRASASGQKSKYFEPDSESESGKNEAVTKKRRGRGSSAAKPSKAKKVRLTPPDAPSDDDGDDYKEELEEPNQAADDSDEEFDEDAPPKVTFIPLPKLRDTGGIEYADDRLHPNTMAFLKDLKANNKRSWLKRTSPPFSAPVLLIVANPHSPRRRVPSRPQGLGVVRHRPD